MNLSPHFTLADLIISPTATNQRLTEQFSPPPDVVKNLERHAALILEPLRTELVKKNRHLVITSAYRCPRLNEQVGGAKNSQHLRGEATDIQVPGVSNRNLIDLIVALKLPFDQLIEEFGSWVHISSASKPHKQILAAKKTNGKTVYENFIN